MRRCSAQDCGIIEQEEDNIGRAVLLKVRVENIVRRFFTAMEYDVFISHASEDKDAIARPLATRLASLGYRVWFDDFALSLGDSLRRSIDRGLASCRFGVVILSKQFFAKNWPAYELDGLTTREQSAGKKVIVPLWHGLTRDDVQVYSPTLADRVAAETTLPLDVVAESIAKVLGPPFASARPLKTRTIIPLPDDEKTCPRCGPGGRPNRLGRRPRVVPLQSLQSDC